jgi:hypothetical protein
MTEICFFDFLLLHQNSHFMKNKFVSILFFMVALLSLQSCGDLIAKQKAIHSVQNYRAGKNPVNFKSWLEDRKESHPNNDFTWEAGRLKKGLWVVQITFQSDLNLEHYLYLVDLDSGRIRGADGGFSEQTLREFEESSPEFI